MMMMSVRRKIYNKSDVWVLTYAERFQILDIHFRAVSRWFFIWEIQKFNSIIYYHIQKADIEAIQISSLTDCI